jgi:hypothetical protein
MVVVFCVDRITGGQAMQLYSNVVDLLLSRLLRNLMGPVTPTTSEINLIKEFSQETNNIIASKR